MRFLTRPAKFKTGLLHAVLFSLMPAMTLQALFNSRLFAADQNAASKSGKSEITIKEVPTVDGQKFAEILKRLRGRVVVVNLWATWCVPCRQEFPLLVQLYEQYKSKGLELLAISNDDLQNLDDVKDFIRDRHVTFTTFIVDPKGANSLREAIYPHWTGALPLTFFFDKQGVLKSHLSGALNSKDFESAVKPLL